MQIKIHILGDICSAFGAKKWFTENGGSAALSGIAPLLRDGAFAVANLECPVTERTQKAIKTGPNLKGEPGMLPLLKQAGISAVSLANNHIKDYKEDGLLDTLQLCRESELPYYGAGASPQEAAKPFYTELSGVRFGFLSFAEEEFNGCYPGVPGANLWDAYDGPEAIRSAKAACDYLLVQYHGGIEHYRYPSPLLQKKCRAMARAGADFVTCQHSHCIGTRESFAGCEILYGQGNAVFGCASDKEWNQGLLATFCVEDGKAAVRYRLLSAHEDGVFPATQEQTEEKLAEIEQCSAILADSTLIKDKWQQYCRRQTDTYMPALLCRGAAFEKGNRLLKGFPARLLARKRRRMVAMNIVRCEAHREVLQTILEEGSK